MTCAMRKASHASFNVTNGSLLSIIDRAKLRNSSCMAFTSLTLGFFNFTDFLVPSLST